MKPAMRLLYLAVLLTAFGLVSSVSWANDGPPVTSFLDSNGTFTTFAYPGSYFTAASGLNNSGQIVGTYDPPIGSQNGFVKTGNTYSQIVYPGSIVTEANGINNNGEIVGNYFGGGYSDIAGVFAQITVPGSSSTMAYGVNDSGTIVGSYYDGLVEHGFLYSGGHFTTIDYPGVSDTEAYGINNLGEIVGEYESGAQGKGHGFLYVGGSFTSIDYPGAPFSTAILSINNNGDFSGYYYYYQHGYFSPPTVNGFVNVSGIFSTLDYPSPSAWANYVTGINDNDQVVGYYFPPPVPEPPSLLSVGSGLVVIAVFIRSRLGVG